MSVASAQMVGEGAPPAELEQILAAARAVKRVESPAIRKIAYNHAAMIDLILANPAISQNQIAQHFGLTPSWVSQVMVSDAFQSALAKRREEIIDPILRLTVEDNFKALVARSLDILQQKLNRPALEIPDNLALRALEIGSRAAGYGAKDDSAAHPPSTPAEVHIHLEQLGGGLISLLQRKRREAEVLVGETSATAPAPLATPTTATAAAQLAELTNDSPQE